MPNDVIATLSAQIDANTIKLRTEMDRAAKQTRQSMGEIKGSVQEAKASIALLGEEVGVHLDRHLRGFLAKLPGVAPALSSAFNAAAVVGIGLAIAETGKKAYEAIQKQLEVTEKLKESFEAMQEKSRLSNDELAVTNDRLQEQIAKITGGHVNRLALELDEARVSADKLLESLKADSKATEALLKENHIGWTGELTGQADTSENTKFIKAQDKALADLVETYNEKLHVEGADRSAIEAERRIELIKREKQQIQDLIDLRKQTIDDSTIRGGKTFGGLSQEANIAILTGQIGIRTGQLDRQGVSDSIGDNTNKLANVKAGAEAARKARKEFSEMVAGMLEDSRLAAEMEQRINQGLTTPEEFFKAENEEIRKQAELVAQSAAEYRKDTADKAAGMRTERDAAQQAFQEFVQDSQLRVQFGEESESQRVRDVQAALAETYSIRAASLDAEMQMYVDGTREYERVLQERQKLDAEYSRQRQDLQREQWQASIRSVFDEMANRTTQISQQFKEIISGAVNSANDTIAKMMTGDYHHGDWKQTGKQIFGGIAKTGLQDAEGYLLKGLHLGGKGKLGTQSNPMYTKSVDGIPGAGSGSLSSLFSNLGGQGSQAGGSGGMGGWAQSSARR